MPPKHVRERCSYCNQLVRCNATNPRKSMSTHQNMPICYEVPSIKNRSVKGNDCGGGISESNGPMNMNIHILPQSIPVLPLPEFLEAHVFNDPASSEMSNISSAAMVIPSEMEAMVIPSEMERRMFGKTLIFIDDNESFVYKDHEVKQPSFEPYMFQKKLMNDYFDELQRKRYVRNQRRSKSELEAQVGLKPVDSVVLDVTYIHSIKKHFTTSEVDKFLSLMDDITKTSYNTTVNKTQWRTIKKNYDKFVEVFSPLSRPEYTLPSEMYGTDSVGNPLEPYYGVSVNILEEIGFELLRVKRVQENFAFEHEPMKNNNGDRLTGPFHTAELFKKLDCYVKKRHGEDAVALCLALYSDPTKLNPTMSRNAHPVYLTILNILHSKPIFAGFIPHEVHNIDVLEDYLSINMRINVNKIKDEILQCLKPSDMMRFFEFLLDPLFDLSENGIAWQVGQGNDAEIRRFVPFLVDLIGDELIQSERTGCSYQCQRFSCSRCLRINCFSFYNPPIDNDLSIGSYVTFQYNNCDYESYIVPYNISSLNVTEDSTKTTTKETRTISLTNFTDVYVLNERDNQWYDIKKIDQTEVYVDTKVKKVEERKSTIYKVKSIQRNRGVRINAETSFAIEDVNIKNLITSRRPYHGLCNFGLGGTWKNAVIVRVSSDLNDINGHLDVLYDDGDMKKDNVHKKKEVLLDVLYDDGDMETNIPRDRFVCFDLPRNDSQMNRFSEGKLAILLRRIKHFSETGNFNCNPCLH